MFISHRYRLVFLEIQRTGSNSITHVLTQLDPDSPTVESRKQNWAIGYHDLRVPDLARAENYSIIGAHRNPYSRLWSHWKHRHKIGNPAVFKTVSWQEYVDWTIEPATVARIQDAMLERSVCEMTKHCGVSHWLRFENLTEDWHKLSVMLNLPLLELPHVNASPTTADWGSAYDELSAARVYQRFKDDFDTFSYAEDSWAVTADA